MPIMCTHPLKNNPDTRCTHVVGGGRRELLLSLLLDRRLFFQPHGPASTRYDTTFFAHTTRKRIGNASNRGSGRFAQTRNTKTKRWHGHRLQRCVRYVDKYILYYCSSSSSSSRLWHVKHNVAFVYKMVYLLRAVIRDA